MQPKTFAKEKPLFSDTNCCLFVFKGSLLVTIAKPNSTGAKVIDPVS